jgi:hypothetical protein
LVGEDLAGRVGVHACSIAEVGAGNECIAGIGIGISVGSGRVDRE